jgi:hypothetical protein
MRRRGPAAGPPVPVSSPAAETGPTLQLIPYSSGAHVGLQGAFVIADFDDAPSVAFLATATEGQTIEEPSIGGEGRVHVRYAALRGAAPHGLQGHDHDNGGGTMDDLTSGSAWRKSSYSSSSGDNCVEVATTAPTVAVRDTKDPYGPALAFGNAEWRQFTRRVKASGLA